MSFNYKLDVEPGLKRYTLHKRHRNISQNDASTSRRMIIVPKDSKNARSTIFNKEKVLINSPTSKHKRGTKNTTESPTEKTVANKGHRDIGINTLVRGPIKCNHSENTCTNIRQRSKHNPHGTKQPYCRMRAKEIQVVIPKSYFLADKACAQSIETSSCGTQFFEQFLAAMKPELCSLETTDNETVTTTDSSSDTELPISGAEEDWASNVKPQPILPELSTPEEPVMSLPERDSVQTCSAQKRNSYFSQRCMASKRWSISPYSVRGPDF